MARPYASLLAVLMCAGAALDGCSPPATPGDAAPDVAPDGPAQADASDDVPLDGADPRAPLAYMPEGCSYTVHTTSGTRNNVRSQDTVFGATPAPQYVHTTWPADPASTVAVLWNTDEGTSASVVQYGTTMDPASWTQTARGHASTGGSGGGNVLRVHEVHVCGLTADTTYYYRAGGEGHWSEVQSFKTAPAPGGSSYDVNFAVSGDSRDSADIWRMIQERVLAVAGMRQPDFEVFTGDAVFLGTSQDLWNAWFASAAATQRRMPFLFAHGNHEALAVNYLMQIAQPQADSPDQDELYFSVNYGPVHFAVLNDSPRDLTTLLTGPQRQWLEADLRGVDRAHTPWVVLVHHKGAFSSSMHTSDPDVVQIRATLPPVYAMYNVDVALNGHDHDFEITWPLMGDGTRAASGQRGTVYVTAAAAGANLYPSRTSAWTRVSEMIANFALVHATATTLEITPYRIDGTVIDAGHTTLTRP